MLESICVSNLLSNLLEFIQLASVLARFSYLSFVNLIIVLSVSVIKHELGRGADSSQAAKEMFTEPLLCTSLSCPHFQYLLAYQHPMHVLQHVACQSYYRGKLVNVVTEIHRMIIPVHSSGHMSSGSLNSGLMVGGSISKKTRNRHSSKLSPDQESI